MKILVRLPNWLGDVVMSTAFIASAQQLYPGASIDVIIKKELAGIADLIPGLRNILSFSKQEFRGLSGVYRFGKKLQIEKYDLFFCLPNSLSSAVMGWASGAKKKIGFNKEGRFFLLTNNYKKPLNMHRADEYVYLLEQFDRKKIMTRRVNLDAGHEKRDENLAVINFNSEAVSRRMPVDKGKHIINTLTNTFSSTKFIFIGAAKEREYVDRLIIDADNPERLVNDAGKTDLQGLAHLLGRVKVVLSTDSGPAHLANSIGTPTVALFGAGNEQNTAPYNKKGLTTIRAGKLECEPCTKNTCILYGVPKCMELLDEITIVDALSLYLNHA